MDENQLRELKRYYPSLKSLRRDVLHNIIPMELYHGMGDKLVQMYVALHARIKEIVNDPYVDILTMDVESSAGDEQKVATISVLIGQLTAYVESTIDYLEETLKENKAAKRGTSKEDEKIMKRFEKLMDEDE